MSVKRIRPKDEIIELLLIYIQTEALQPHDKLPSERELCALWDANRSTLRSALDRLKESGIIYSVPGRGYFVNKPKFQRNLQDMRPFDRLASEQGRQLETVELRKKVIPCEAAMAKYFGIAPGDDVLELIRLRYLDKLACALEYSYINLALCRGLETIDFYQNSLYETLERQYGIVPAEGSQRISITYINENESTLFQVPVGTPALYLKGLSYSQGQTHAFDYFKSVVLPDQIQFSCTLRMNDIKPTCRDDLNEPEN